MKTEEAILKIAKILDVLAGHFIPDCGGDFKQGTFYCKGCSFYHQCKKGTEAQDLCEELQSLLVDRGAGDKQDEPVHIWVDGWCRGNGTPEAWAGWSVVVIVDGKKDNTKTGIVHGLQTNNVAEYQAFIGGLRWGQGYDRPIVVHTDSALVIGQVIKGWKVKAEHLRPFVGVARTLVELTGAQVVKEPRERIVEILGH